ncbi:DNA-binding transcriptional regulator, MerR family [Actinacidiphila alni]|uniref:DNA-binding transcriptional regulator, MerR family n=1 Tax=Actinacidiphila alni TaxID=380248 RepID=A0A1I2JCA3_9ACTN|nr:MerR family transcriptional regulator [Actinacidiphila alni]SFF51473.1 DNA-binding transcriptional regulator, MerR family [Actinacidiphila alni]
MRIGEVARGAGVSVRALRYYEEQGLLVAERMPSGHRRYPKSAVERVRFIQLLYAAGLNSRTILQILPFLDTLVATPRMTQRLRDERDRLRTQIDDLTTVCDRLDELIGLAVRAESAPAECAAREEGKPADP